MPATIMTNTDNNITPIPVSRPILSIGLLGASLITGVLLFAFIARYVPQLQSEITLHFTHEGISDRRGPPQGLFYLPLMGALIWLLNTLIGLGLKRNRVLHVGADLLWANTLAVQLILWAAILRLVGIF
jgi:hypothetical protein